MNVKRAMLVCKVVAGRMGSDQDDVDKEDGGFDSIVGITAIGSGGGSLTRMTDDEELLVFNPKVCATLLCNSILSVSHDA